MTHGEEWARRKRELLDKIENLEIELDLDNVDITKGLPPRMRRDEAVRYYTEKLRRYWREAGYCQRRPYPPLRWVLEWVERAYQKGYEEGARDAKNNANTKDG